MNVEEALIILDTVLQQNFLNNLQELVFRQAWLGQTYPEIAESSGYNANYIKDVGSKLWKLLSKAFEEEVTKSNFRSVLRRRYVAFQHANVTGREIASPKQIGESQQTPAVATVVVTPIIAENIKVNSQTTKTDLLRATPQLIDAKEKTANTRLVIDCGCSLPTGGGFRHGRNWQDCVAT